MPPKTFSKKKEWPSAVDDQGVEFHVHSYLKCDQCHKRIRVGFGGWSNLLDMHRGSKNCRKKMRRDGAPLQSKAPSQSQSQPTESEVFLRTLAASKLPSAASNTQAGSVNAPVSAPAASLAISPSNLSTRQPEAQANPVGDLHLLVQAASAPE